MEEQIQQALDVLKRGGIILYPTDTVWGIGCDATDDRAVGRIYALKKSEGKEGMLVLLDSPEKVSRYVQKVPDAAWQLFEAADKPLTLVLPGAHGVAPALVPADGTLAIRIPNHEFCRRLIHRLNRPLVSTSANISGYPTPQNRNEIAKEIVDGVDFAVDPACEETSARKVSSIVFVGTGNEIKIIRP